MAQKKYTDDVLHWVATGDYSSGTLLSHPAGKIGILVNDVVTGDLCALEPNVQVLINNSGVAFSAGDTVGYDQTTDTAVAAAGGTFDCGKAVKAAGTSEQVLVLLNSL